jgi:acetyl-CoA carboxylase carboxyltransferase component
MTVSIETKTTVLPDPYEELTRRRKQGVEGGGAERVAKVHESGRQTARERIEQLIDAGSWYEIGMLAEPEIRRPDRVTTGDGVVTGLGRIDGRRVAIIAIDATVLTGTTAPVNMRKQNRVAEWAGRRGMPLICLSDMDGGRLPDLLGWRFSGVPFDFGTFLQSPEGHPSVPHMTAVLGPSYGDAALHAAMGHFVVMRKDAAVALSGPPVIEAAIGEAVDAEELGGPKVAHETSGSVHMVVDGEAEALEALRRYMSFMPDSAAQPAPVAPAVDPKRDPKEIASLVPREPRRGYDMRKVMECVVDADSMFQWGERYGRSLITAFARIQGQAVGIVGSQPMQRAGVLDVPALTKLTGFVKICDTFNIPLAFLQDVPGLMIGKDAERGGILQGYKHLVTALAYARVPKIAVVVRKAYGGGHIALGGRPVRPDLLFAWPTAEMGFMAPDTGVRTVYRRKLQATLDSEGRDAYDAMIAELEAEWAAESQPWEAAANIILDDVIDPARTRDVIAEGIEFAWPTGPRVTPTGC